MTTAPTNNNPQPTQPTPKKDSSGAKIDPPVPTFSDSIAGILSSNAIEFGSAFFASDNGKWGFTYNNQSKTITSDDFKAACKKFGEVLNNLLQAHYPKAAKALGLYNQQKKIDDEWWLTSHVIKFFGNVRDPGPVLKEAVAAADKAHSEALSLISKAEFYGDGASFAAIAVTDCIEAAVKADLLAQGYFEETISAAEFQVKVLEGVVEASKATLMILSAVAIPGGSAAVAGAIAGVSTTVIETIDDASLGKPFDPVKLTVKLACDLAFAKFTKGLSKAVEEEITKRIVKDYAGKFTEEVVTKVVESLIKVVMTQSAQAAIKSLQGHEVKGSEIAEEVQKEWKKELYDEVKKELIKSSVK